MSVRMDTGKLNTGRVLGQSRALTRAWARVKSKLVHISRCHGSIGQPNLLFECHVEFGTQTHSIEDDAAIFPQLGITKMENLQVHQQQQHVCTSTRTNLQNVSCMPVNLYWLTYMKWLSIKEPDFLVLWITMTWYHNEPRGQARVVSHELTGGWPAGKNQESCLQGVRWKWSHVEDIVIFQKEKVMGIVEADNVVHLIL